MKIGLYSITYLGLWYQGPALTLEELILRARGTGTTAWRLTGRGRTAIRWTFPGAGASICRSGRTTRGSTSTPSRRTTTSAARSRNTGRAQLLYVRDLIRMTADLGVKTLRMFAAWPGVTIAPEGATYLTARQIWREAHKEPAAEQTWAWCREGLIESARMAGEAGVTLALQNHAPVTNSPADTLRLIREVASPHLKACIDAPLAALQGVTSMQQMAREVGPLQVLTHFGGEYDRDADGVVRGFDRNPDSTLTPEYYYADFAEGMQEIGYEGYIGYELCHPLPKVDGKTVGIEFADKNAQLAADYMRGVLKKTGTLNLTVNR